jgi:hypothetical protein
MGSLHNLNVFINIKKEPASSSFTLPGEEGTYYPGTFDTSQPKYKVSDGIRS